MALKAGKVLISGMIATGAALLAGQAQAQAQARLQCVPYARAHSAVAIRGNANTWWGKADGRYARGHAPAPGAVLAFRGTARMPAGHVAVVREVLDERRVLLDHANWSRPGAIERAALAVDVSPAGDWSAVRVFHGPSGRLGVRTNPTFGFIYGRDRQREHAGGPWIEALEVIWLDQGEATRLRSENVALFEG